LLHACCPDAESRGCFGSDALGHVPLCLQSGGQMLQVITTCPVIHLVQLPRKEQQVQLAEAPDGGEGPIVRRRALERAQARLADLDGVVGACRRLKLHESEFERQGGSGTQPASRRR
jgi:hypothetical protein